MYIIVRKDTHFSAASNTKWVVIKLISGNKYRFFWLTNVTGGSRLSISASESINSECRKGVNIANRMRTAL